MNTEQTYRSDWVPLMATNATGATHFRVWKRRAVTGYWWQRHDWLHEGGRIDRDDWSPGDTHLGLAFREVEGPVTG